VIEKIVIGNATLYHGDCLEVMRTLPDCSVDAVVTDPPYGLSFMGKRWDYDVPSVEVWAECLRVLKPGGHLLAFAGTRTQHRMAVRIEDAGFEIRDMIAWVYGSGFPKSLDVSKAVDKQDAADMRRVRQLRFTEWVRGTVLTAARIDAITGTNMGGHYTTAASQPFIATREYFEMLRPHFGCAVPDWVEQMVDERTVESENFKRREVVDAREMRDTSKVRIAVTASADEYDATATREVAITAPATEAAKQWQGWGTALKPALEPITVARKPLIGTVAENVLAHGTGAINVDECRVAADDGRPLIESRSDASLHAFGNGLNGSRNAGTTTQGRWPANLIHDGSDEVVGLLGSAARFFYCAKASKADRDEGCEGLEERKGSADYRPNDDGGAGLQSRLHGATTKGRNFHPTVKPTDLMRYLCRLVTPPGGIVLDPFMGSGSTGKAAKLEWVNFLGIEREHDYLKIAHARIEAAELNLGFFK
jgi:DNA modification methylase